MNVKGQGHSVTLLKVTRIECPSKFQTSSQKPQGLFESRFYIEHLCVAGTKVYISGPGHMTKMAMISCPYMVLR